MSKDYSKIKTYPNFKVVRRYSLEQLVKMLDDVSDNIEIMNKEIERLRTENAELKNEAYKDEELKKLNEQIKEKNEEIRFLSASTFNITEKEAQEIKKFTEKHNHGSAGAIGGQFTYKFTPTSIGTIGTIICTCGEEFTFSNLF